MNDETAFLRCILQKPEDAALRLAYADWLDERGDPRAQFVRMDPGFERISFLANLEKYGPLDQFDLLLGNHPELKREADERRATKHLREVRRVLGSALDPDWVAFMNTLADPFQPFLFYTDCVPEECAPEELRFAERLGTRGSIITLESNFRDEQAWDPGLVRDLGFLCQLQLGECCYGAIPRPIHPFMCQLKATRRPLTASDVLAALRPTHFCSKYIHDLQATHIPYPGYHPRDTEASPGTDNDEIHSDFSGQYIFQKETEDYKNKVDEFDGTHGVIKRFVTDGQLWYVLLHTKPIPRFSRLVVLLAVGLSPNGDRLVGVVTHQGCHNLCD